MSELRLLLCGVLAAAAALASSGAERELVVLSGRVVCLEQESARCDELGARFAFATAGGERVHFLAGDPQAEMFIDPEVRGRELVVRGWRRPADRFEILSVYSRKHGHLHDIYYRCDVCNITATAPGPCWCCRAPFELRETPVADEVQALATSSEG